MSDKTCLTCTSGIRYLVSCRDRENQHAGLHQPDDTCRDYIERADSVEQIALELLDVMGCENCPWPGIKCDPTGDTSDCGYRSEMIDRLRALGIEVEE